MELSEKYWQERYEKNATGWDVGSITKPLKDYIDQLTDKSIKLLIPGAGNGYEAEYFFKLGFKNTFVLDVAEAPLQNIKKRLPDFPDNQLIHMDFFEHNGKYDLIIEQTFYCAINPQLRDDYVHHVSELLNPNGKLVGLLWDAPMFSDHPPYGGSIQEYKKRFRYFFEIDILEKAYNSITPRDGNEAFIKFIKKAR